ncbi:hypothetical protein [Methanosarcina horonobensis]|uniref:hypothetical protein n=1 Tax=Methanosarcina horonobensis TaxID=418008 RepID=UPI0013018B1A|nr:hypothetical protein [Methanosarcina horonobensis]
MRAQKTVVVDHKDCKRQNDQKNENPGLDDVCTKVDPSKVILLLCTQPECQPHLDVSDHVRL